MAKQRCRVCGADTSYKQRGAYCRRCIGKRILRARQAYTKTPGVVYIAQNPVGGEIKIGFTIQPEVRLKNLRREYAGCEKLVFVATIEVPNGEYELTLHRMFDELRIENEWFTPCQVLYVLIHSDKRWVIHN